MRLENYKSVVVISQLKMSFKVEIGWSNELEKNVLIETLK